MIRVYENRMEKPSGSNSMRLGMLLISTMFFTMAVTTVLFIFGVSITKYHFILAVFLSAAMLPLFFKISLKEWISMVGIGVVILCGCIFVSGQSFDWSWDGNAYHKTITGFLKHGWNPLSETYYAFAERQFPRFSPITPIWYDAYPKGSEILAACAYSITGDIEYGKYFNLLSIVVGFLFSYAYMEETKVLRPWQSALCGFFFAVNPIALSQVLTYYNDAFLWQMLLICICALIYLTFEPDGYYKKLCYALIFMTINIGFNIKFSAIIFFFLFCAIFFLYWTLSALKKAKWGECRKKIYEQFLVFFSSVLSGTLLIGATSYVTNTLRHHNPLYTMIGKDSVEMIKGQLPPVFEDMSNFGRFWRALFSKTDGFSVSLKIPFTMFKEEINPGSWYPAAWFDVRIGGWGVLFSGIFLISILVLMLCFIRRAKKNVGFRDVGLILIGINIVAVIVVPGMCWARYYPGLTYFPVVAMFLLFWNWNEDEDKKKGPIVMAIGLVILLLANFLPNVMKTVDVFKEFPVHEEKLEILKQLSAEQTIEVYTNSNFPGELEGRYFTLIDRNITNVVNGGKIDPETSYLDTIFSNVVLAYKLPTQAESVEEVTPLENQFAEIDAPEELIRQYAALDHALILIAAKDEASDSLTEELSQQIKDLGLGFMLKGHHQYGYLAAVLDGEILMEQMGDQHLTCENLTVGEHIISMQSGGWFTGNIASIQIDGAEYALNGRGLNLVVVDTLSWKIIDRVCIDTFEGNFISR